MRSVLQHSLFLMVLWGADGKCGDSLASAAEAAWQCHSCSWRSCKSWLWWPCGGVWSSWSSLPSTGVLPAGTPQGLARAALCRSCTVVGGEFLSGFVLYGIPVGLSRFVKHHWPGHPLVGHGLVWWPAAAYWLGRPGRSSRSSRSSRWLSAGLCSRKWVEKRDFSEHKIDLVCSCPVLAGHCELKSWFWGTSRHIYTHWIGNSIVIWKRKILYFYIE